MSADEDATESAELEARYFIRPMKKQFQFFLIKGKVERNGVLEGLHVDEVA
jgi:hypothetical protein